MLVFKSINFILNFFNKLYIFSEFNKIAKLVVFLIYSLISSEIFLKLLDSPLVSL